MDEFGFDRFCISLVETYPCTNKTELRLREGHWIREISTLNKQIAGRDKKQYYEDSKDNRVEQRKQYYENNKEKIKHNYEENKEKITEQRKQYREDNKEKITEQKKQYYENNKEKLTEKNKQKITCECGSTVRISDLSAHRKTKKHQAFMSQAASN
eukprot:763361-Hanusia_phi.AAC.1